MVQRAERWVFVSLLSLALAVCGGGDGNAESDVGAESAQSVCPSPGGPLDGPCEGNAECELGSECCCGGCMHSIECSCQGGRWSCLYTDYCLAPWCEQEDCHTDCPCVAQCVDGVETLYACAPMPCSYSTDYEDCEMSSTPCPFGCRDVYGFGPLLAFHLEPGTLCRPGAGHHVGDPCTTDDDCQPTWATVVDGQVTTPHLACDAVASACVEAAAPEPSDWLQTACASDETGSPYQVGWVSAASCEQGVCLFVQVDGALRQGCSLRCTHDGQCPPGAVCAVDAVPWGEGASPTVCVPFAWLPSWE